jgi:hypothetical protein
MAVPPHVLPQATCAKQGPDVPLATPLLYSGHRSTSHRARVAGRCGGRRAAPRVLRGHLRRSGRPSARTDGRHDRARLVTPPRCEGLALPPGTPTGLRRHFPCLVPFDRNMCGTHIPRMCKPPHQPIVLQTNARSPPNGPGGVARRRASWRLGEENGVVRHPHKTAARYKGWNISNGLCKQACKQN